VTSGFHNDARLTVGRWICSCSVPSSYEAISDLRHTLEKTLTGALLERCDMHVAPVVRREDPSVWRIRTLDMKVSFARGEVQASDAADALARQLASSLAGVIRGREENDAFLRFENYASFVTRFVLDLAGNRAWGKWYYEEFEDLRIFPPSQAIRTVLLSAPRLAIDVIVELAARQNLDTVLVVLTEKDASLIFDSCFESGSAPSAAGSLNKWVSTLLESCLQEPLFPRAPAERCSCDAILLFARALLRQPGADADEQLRGAILGLVELRRTLSAIRSPLVLESLIHKAAAGELGAAIDLATHSGALSCAGALQFFADRMQGDTDWGREAAAVILSGNLPARAISVAAFSKAEPLLSPFAGIFLLGPSFLNLRSGHLSEAAAESAENSAALAATLRHFLAIKCLGSVRASDVSGDPAVCLFTGFAGPSFLSSLKFIETAGLNFDAVRKCHWRTMRESERISDRCVLAELVSLGDREVLILRDLFSNEWLDVFGWSGEQSDLSALTQKRVKLVFGMLAVHPKLLVFGDALASRVDLSIFGELAAECAVAGRDETTQAAQLADQSGLSAKRLQTLLPASRQELAYFSLRAFLPNSAEEFDDTFSLVARAVLRDFSRRLFGFDLSSPEYLYQNFLAGLGSLLCRDEAFEVRLPASPLSVILRMAGLQQQKFSPPWLKGREVWLLPPQD